MIFIPQKHMDLKMRMTTMKKIAANSFYQLLKFLS